MTIDFRTLLLNDLTPSLGCTEPIAIALCCAKARDILMEKPEKIVLECSGNIIKNAKSVIVPNSGGLRGIEIAAALGMVAGGAGKSLEVLRDITPEQIQEATDYVNQKNITVKLITNVDLLFIRSEMTSGMHRSVAVISGQHDHFHFLEKDGKEISATESPLINDCHVPISTERTNLDDCRLHDIVDFSSNYDFEADEELKNLLLRQIDLNKKASDEGLEHKYGMQIGRTFMEYATKSDLNEIRAKTTAAADARMGGCPLPVMINSGSGTQGITVSLPVYFFAEKNAIEQTVMLKALLLSNLTNIYMKHFIGKLSAFCGGVSAAAAAGGGIGYLRGFSEDEIGMTITNTLATSGGIICDGAKASCASKISIALENMFLALDLAKNEHAFQPGEGIVGRDIDETIRNIGKVARGMQDTDEEVLDIMLS